METSIRWDRIGSVLFVIINILLLIGFLSTEDDALLWMWGATLPIAIFSSTRAWSERNA